MQKSQPLSQLLSRVAQLGPQVFIVALLSMVVAGIWYLPLVDSASMITAIVFGGIGFFGISMLKDPRERMILLWVFGAAYALRIVFTLVAYSMGLIDKLGGGDDTGWAVCWEMSRYWRGWLGYIPTIKHIPGQGQLPETIWHVYDRTRQGNLGFHFFVSYFYYLIDVRSQMALSFINCFMNSMTCVVIYKVSRDFFSERASLLAAGAAVILPSYLAWSALTIKETWLILFEITAFFAMWRAARDRSILYGLLAVLLIWLVLGIRFYVAWVLMAAGSVALLCFRSPRPKVRALQTLGAFLILYLMATGLGIVQFNVAEAVQKQMAEFEAFRGNISAGSSRYAVNSGVQLPYDPSTPGGMIMLILVGAIYLLLSPFPWQALSGRQIFALPDVLLWWTLVLVFILPGIRYTWKRHEGLMVGLVAYLMPLILLYSLVFGNIGLAYRQRAQLMPFLLVFAAAGYDARRRQQRAGKDLPDRDDILAQLRQTLQPQNTNGLPSPSAASTTFATQSRWKKS